jgi:hypothetical protein
MLVALPELHRAMQGLHAPEQVMKWMTDVSGLPVKLIVRLYKMGPIRMPAASDAASNTEGEDNASVEPTVDRSAEG